MIKCYYAILKYRNEIGYLKKELIRKASNLDEL